MVVQPVWDASVTSIEFSAVKLPGVVQHTSPPAEFAKQRSEPRFSVIVDEVLGSVANTASMLGCDQCSASITSIEFRAARSLPKPMGNHVGIPDFDLEANFDVPVVGQVPERRRGGKTMADQAEAFQIELAVAFREHRSRVELILDQNMEAMERIDHATQLEMSKLRAENANLREQAGLRSQEDQLWQTVMFDAAAKPLTPKEAKLKTMFNDATRSVIDDESPSPTKKRSNTLKAGDMSLQLRGSPKAGEMSSQLRAATNGMWQSFVCWVPSGAALEQPQPWQPLPEKAMLTNGALQQRKEHDKAKEQDSNDGAPSFEVVEVFVATARELELSRKNFVTCRTLTEEKMQKPLRGESGSEIDPDEGGLVFNGDSADWFTIHPHDTKRVIWDISTLVLVVYDMVTIPLGVFDFGDPLFLSFMSWTTRVFWTADMPMSACTGVVMPDGTVRGDVHFIVRRYLKTWFAVDFFIVTSDWLELAVSASAGAGFLGRMARAFRIVRVLRLLRLARIKSVVEHATERIQSDRIPFYISVVKFAVLILGIAHFAACIWWGIGNGQVANSWVEKYGSRPSTAESQYLLCLHFTLAQFTGGMDEVAPANALERFYVIVLFLFAFITATLGTSVLTSSLTQMHVIGGVRERQVSTLRKFLRQNHLSSALAMRITRSAQHALSADLTADVVELLPVVSEPLRVEMHFEMYTAVLCNHALFADYVHAAPQVMRRICHYAMSTVQLSHGDVVFSRGEAPSEPKMYFLINGTADYDFESETHGLSDGSWIAEPVLWTHWTHMGCLTATSEVRLAALDAKAFQDVCDRFKDIKGFDPKFYAADFVAQLNNEGRVSDMITARYGGATTASSTTRGASFTKTAAFSKLKQTFSSHSIVPTR